MSPSLPDVYVYEFSQTSFLVQLASHTARALFDKRDYINLSVNDICLLYDMCDGNCLVLKHLGKITREPKQWDKSPIDLQSFLKTRLIA